MRMPCLHEHSRSTAKSQNCEAISGMENLERKGKVNSMGHERFRSSHFRERVVSLHGESGGLKIRRERVGTVTTHLAPWSIG